MESWVVGSVCGGVMVSSAILPLCKDNTHRITYKKKFEVVKRERS